MRATVFWLAQRWRRLCGEPTCILLPVGAHHAIQVPSETERGTLIQEHLQKLRQRLKEQLPGDNTTLDQIEEAVGRIGREMPQDLQRRLLQRRNKQARDNRTEC